MARTREFNEEKVMETATELFWGKGYNAVSTQDLVDAFGMSRSSMYGAYKDKKSLFLLALQHYSLKVPSKIIELMALEKPVKEKLRDVLLSIVKANLNDEKYKGCFMVNSSIELAPHDKDVLEIIQSNRTNIIKSIQRGIEKGIDNEEISRDKNPNALAIYFYNIISGLQVDAKINKIEAHFTETIEIALKSLDD